MKRSLLTVLGLLCYVIGLMAQWSSNPEKNNRITEDGKTINDYFSKVSKDGLTYVLLLTPVDGKRATVLQIVDKDGKKVFPDEGAIISHEKTWPTVWINELLFVDDDGNAIIAVSDCRYSDEWDESYTLYKVSPEGEHLWPENGIDLCRGIPADMITKLKMIQLEDHSYVFSWASQSGTERTSIQLQRLSRDGEFQWENNIVLQESNISYDHPYLVNAGNNEFNLLYVKDNILYAQKFDFEGLPVWAQETRIYRGGFPSVPLQTVLRVHPGPDNSVFVSWRDDRDDNDREMSYIAHVKSDGTLGFTGEEGGEKITYTEYRSFSPEMVYDPENNCIYAVCRETNGVGTYQRLVIQKIAMTGELLWEPEGILIDEINANNAQFGYYSLQDAEEGKFVVFYMTSNGWEDVVSYAALIDGETGNFVWEENKIGFSTIETNKSDLVINPFINNKSWIAAWKDDRTDDHVSNSGIYLQRINFDGTLGDNSTAIHTLQENKNFTVIPSFIKKSTQFYVENRISEQTDISIYSLAGQKIATVYKGKMEQGAQNIHWERPENLNSGIYIVRFTGAEGIIKTTQIIIH
jgi:hypothetical protein